MRNAKWLKKTAAMALAGTLLWGTAPWTGAGFAAEVQAEEAAAAPEIDMDQPGTLTILKYDYDKNNNGEGLVAVPGAGYTVYKVMSLTKPEGTGKYTYTPEAPFAEVLKTNKVTPDELGEYSAQQIEALAAELAEAAKTANAAAGEQTTGDDGKAEFTDLDLGYYLVVETTVPEGYIVTGNPFLVALPQTKEDGTGWEYAVTARPKNQKVSIDKEIDTAEKNETGLSQDGTVAVGDFVPYKITTKIPNYDNGIFAGSDVTFKITDVMSDGLKAVKNDTHPVTVTVGDAAAIENTDYTVIVAEATETDPDLTIEFTSTFLKGAGSGKNVTVTYYAEVTDKAVAGTVGNTNRPYLEYTNKPGEASDKIEGPEDVTVYTFDINVVKFTNEGGNAPKALEGAEFELHKDDPKGELVEQKKATGADGKLSFEKLDAGIYYLVETKAPIDYTLLANPIKVEITAKDENKDNLADDGGFTLKINGEEITAGNDAGSFVSQTDQTKGDAVIAVENHKGFSLPATGGMGILLFLAVGVVGIVVVSVLLTRKSKDTK